MQDTTVSGIRFASDSGAKPRSGFSGRTVRPANEDELLASCYRKSLALAEKNKIRTLAFPSISTGAYGFPIERASRIALREINNHLSEGSQLEKVVVVCFDRNTYDQYSEALNET